MLFFNFRVTVNLKKKKSMSEKYVTLPNLISQRFFILKKPLRVILIVILCFKIPIFSIYKFVREGV